MNVVSRIYRSFKSALLVSAFLGASVSCLYASDPVECDITLKGTSPQQSQNTIIHIECADNPQGRMHDVFDKHDALQYIEALSLPQEIWTNVLFFIPYKDRLGVSLSSRAFCLAGRQALMTLDLRHLEGRGWAGGPKSNTFDTYLLNNILWTMGSDYLKNLNNNGSDSLSLIQGFVNKRTFLKTHFAQYGNLIETLVWTLVADEHAPGIKALKDHALKNPDSREANQVRFMTYIINEEMNLDDTRRRVPVAQPDLVERFHRTKILRFQIGKESAQKSLPLWEEVLQFSLGPKWCNDLENASKAYFDSATLSMEAGEELDYFVRCTQLYDAYFQDHNAGLSVDNIECAALAHARIVEISDCPLQQGSSLERCVQLYEISLSKQGENAPTKTIKNALRANFQLGLSIFDQKKKIPFLRRSTQLYDQLVLRLGNDIDLKIVRVAKTCHDHMAQATQDLFQKMLCLKRSLQLQEQLVDIARGYGRGAEEENLLSDLNKEMNLLMEDLRKNTDFYMEKVCILDQMLDMDVARSPDFLRNAALVYEITGDKTQAKKLNESAIYLAQKKYDQEPFSDSPSEIFWKLIEASVKAF